MAEMDFRASKGREGRFWSNFGSRSCCMGLLPPLVVAVVVAASLLLLVVKHLNTSVATPGVQFKLILPLLFVTAADEADRSSYNSVFIRSRRAVRLSFVLLLLLVSVEGTSDDDDALLSLGALAVLAPPPPAEDDTADNNVSKSRATPSTKTEMSLHPSIALMFVLAVGRRADTADFISHPKA